MKTPDVIDYNCYINLDLYFYFVKQILCFYCRFIGQSNKIFAFGQAIPDASIGVLRSTLHGSQASLPPKLQARNRSKQRGINPSLINLINEERSEK